MPWLLKIFILYPILCSLLGVTTPNPLWAKGFAGIKTYYIRLDIKYANHKTIKSQLTMTPAETGADPENFSIIPLSHVVSATPQDSNATLEARAKKNAFMNILEQHGLKSVTAHNLDTILSYEGMVCTPMNLQIGPYDKSLKGHPYTAQVQFAPIAFPDQWESLKQKLKIKKIFNDFILLFK